VLPFSKTLAIGSSLESNLSTSWSYIRNPPTFDFPILDILPSRVIKTYVRCQPMDTLMDCLKWEEPLPTTEDEVKAVLPASPDTPPRLVLAIPSPTCSMVLAKYPSLDSEELAPYSKELVLPTSLDTFLSLVFNSVSPSCSLVFLGFPWSNRIFLCFSLLFFWRKWIVLHLTVQTLQTISTVLWMIPRFPWTILTVYCRIRMFLWRNQACMSKMALTNNVA